MHQLTCDIIDMKTRNRGLRQSKTERRGWVKWIGKHRNRELGGQWSGIINGQRAGNASSAIARRPRTVADAVGIRVGESEAIDGPCKESNWFTEKQGRVTQRLCGPVCRANK